MHHLRTTFMAIAMAMLALIFAPLKAIAGTLFWTLLPEPRTRGPTFVSGLSEFVKSTATSVMNIFGATRHETLQVVASMRSEQPATYELSHSGTRDPTNINLSVDAAANSILGSVTSLLGACKTALGRVALNPS